MSFIKTEKCVEASRLYQKKNLQTQRWFSVLDYSLNSKHIVIFCTVEVASSLVFLRATVAAKYTFFSARCNSIHMHIYNYIFFTAL